MLDVITNRVLGEPEAETSRERGDPEAPGLEMDETDGHSLLANDRRAHVIRSVAHGGKTTLDELATQIALFETGEGTGQPRKRVYVGLYQTHLPKLRESGAIEYDSRSGTIKPGRNLEGLAALLEFSSEMSTRGDE